MKYFRLALPCVTGLAIGIGLAWGSYVPWLILTGAGFLYLGIKRFSGNAVLCLLLFLGFAFWGYMDCQWELSVARGFPEKDRLLVRVEEVDKNRCIGKILGSSSRLTGKRKLHFYSGGELRPGDLIVGEFFLDAPERARIPGGYNERTHLYSKGIYWKGKAQENPVQIHAPGYYGKFLAFRQRLLEGYTRNMEGDGKALFQALVFGEKGQMDPDMYQSFQLLGLAHLLAVSGLHVGMIASLVHRFLGSAGFWVRNTSACGVLTVYAFLAGFGPSVIRAVGMYLLAAGGKWMLRPRDFWNILAISALVQMLLHPFVLFSVAFQLSYLTLGAIVWSLENQKGMKGISGLAMSTLAATLGSAPLVVIYFHTLPLAGLILNIVYIPLFGGITFLATAGLPLYGLFPSIWDQASSWLSGLLNLFLGGSRRLAALLSFTHWVIAAPKPWEVFLFYYLFHKIFREPYGNLRKMALLLVLLLPLALMPQPWQIAFLDVGQGDSLVLLTGKGGVMVVDGGPRGREVEKYLSWQGSNRPDMLVLTHTDADHMNGIHWLLERKPPGILLLPGGLENEKTEAICELAQKKKVPVKRLFQGDIFTFHETHFQVLWPAKGNEHLPPNNQSLILLVTYKDRKILLAADGEKEILDRLSGFAGTEILKVPHHGSHTGLSPLFFQQGRFQEGIISAGRGNRYGHPNREMLDLLTANGISIHRTDISGTVILEIFSKGDLRIRGILD